MRLYMLAIAAGGPVACSAGDTGDTAGGPAAACISANAVADGHGFGAANPASVEAECLAEGGSSCAADDYISEDAALCLAEVYGLAAGIEPWHTGLVFHHGDMAPRWNVDSTLTRDGAASSGDSMGIAAWSGDLIDVSQWEAMP